MAGFLKTWNFIWNLPGPLKIARLSDIFSEFLLKDLNISDGSRVIFEMSEIFMTKNQQTQKSEHTAHTLAVTLCTARFRSESADAYCGEWEHLFLVSEWPVLLAYSWCGLFSLHRCMFLSMTYESCTLCWASAVSGIKVDFVSFDAFLCRFKYRENLWTWDSSVDSLSDLWTPWTLL